MFSKDARGMAIVDLITGGSTARALIWKGLPHDSSQWRYLCNARSNEHLILWNREFHELPWDDVSHVAIAASQPCECTVHAEPAGHSGGIVKSTTKPPPLTSSTHHVMQGVDPDVISSFRNN
jgi:hypothetical protein